jgi:hypothetical protein
MSIRVDFDKSAGEASVQANQAKPPKRAKAVSPLTIRLTLSERAQLEELAAGMTLSTYVRACLFEREEKRRKRRPLATVSDKQAIADVLALLGQSWIANNLNQLAYQANVGELEMREAETQQIAEAYVYIGQMRLLLVRALCSGA